MRSERLIGPRGIIVAVILAVAGVALGWLCVRSAAVAALAPDAALLRLLAPGDPGAELARAEVALVKQHGHLDATTLARVRAAAQRAPLDARAFLVLGHQQLLDRQPARAMRTLEAGQRLDPREDLIHILLLDRYLRTARFAQAAEQMSVMARLMDRTESVVAQAMAAMATAPDTRPAVRRTLDTDTRLEQAVLTAMAQSRVSPVAIFAFASPAARGAAGLTGGWGQTLVTRQIEDGHFALARAVWQRVYRVPPAVAAAPLVDLRFGPARLPPPFGWTLIAGSLGAADLRNGALAVDYYGRDSGDLATELLVLGAGRYRFAFTVDPGQTDAASKLVWSIACATGAKTSFAEIAVIAAASPRRLAGEFQVPAGCPAQSLTLRGEAGDLPAPTAVTVRDLDLHAVAGARR